MAVTNTHTHTTKLRVTLAKFSEYKHKALLDEEEISFDWTIKP